MNALINLAESIAMILNKENDVVFKEKLKFDIKTLRSLFVSQDTVKNIVDSRLIQSIVLDLEEVDMSLTCDINVNCKVLRTVNKIPTPIRLKATSPFTYVGDLDGNGMSMTKVEDWDLTDFSKYRSTVPIYDYFNDYIYIKKGKIREFLLIKGIFENPEDLKKCCSTSENVANFESDTYPLPLDLAARIKDTILRTELRSYNGEDKEVKLDTEAVKK